MKKPLIFRAAASSRGAVLLPLAMAAGLAATAEKYSYDLAGQPINVDDGNGQTIAYSYDNAANLLSRVVTPHVSNSGASRSASKAQFSSPRQRTSQEHKSGQRRRL